jgi:hypothetical protein
MIDPHLKASLLARQPLQQFSASAPRTACALTGFALELSGFAVQNHPGPLTTISELNMIDIAHIANNRVP